MATTETKTVSLKRETTLQSGILVITGSIIGTGIFINQDTIISAVPSLLYSCLLWIGCGVISIIGALSYSELALMYGGCGGEYIYLKKAYHDSISFSFVLSSLIFIKPASACIFFLFFYENIFNFVYGNNEQLYWPIRLLAVLTIIIVCILNCVSTKYSLIINNVFTYLKVACILMLFIMAIIKVASGDDETLIGSTSSISVDINKLSGAFYTGMFAFDGWNHLGYISEELKNPKKNLVPVGIIGLSIVVICYIMANFSYISILGVNGVINSNSVAVDASRYYLHQYSVIVVTLISLSALGTGNVTSFCGGRLYFDAARDGNLLKLISLLHKKSRTMIPSLIIQTVVTIIMTLSGSDIDSLLVYFGCSTWIFYGLANLAVLVLRFRDKHRKRIFKIFIPLPVIAAIFSFALVILSFVNEPMESGISLVIIVACIIVYFLFVFRGGVLPESVKRFTDNVTKEIMALFSLEMPTDPEELV